MRPRPSTICQQPDPQNTSSTGSGLASYLLGVPSAATDLRGTAEQRLHGNYYGLFVDDVWKATPNLTVNLAVRYDYAAPLVDSYGRQGTLDYANSTPAQTIYLLDQSAQPAVNLSGSPATIRRVPGGMFEPDRKDWSPRLGLAYRVTPNTASAPAMASITISTNRTSRKLRTSWVSGHLVFRTSPRRI